MVSALEARLLSHLDVHQPRLVEILTELVRRPSENRAPAGAESACQEYAAGVLSGAGWEPVLYSPRDVPGLTEHPLYWPGRDYQGRPNLMARRTGRGGGRSLVLSGHADTVPAGSQPWTRDPFGAEICGTHLYGRGSNDMKGGFATNLFVAETLAALDIELNGDLVIESVVDEEFGGVNGTLAGRLVGANGDAAVISEPSFLRICPAQRGGRTVHLTFRAPNAGILCETPEEAGVVQQLRRFLEGLSEFSRGRHASLAVHPYYAHLADPAPVTVTGISTGPWGTGEPTCTPAVCRVALFWQTMPGEKLEDIDAGFQAWFEQLLAAWPETFRMRPLMEYPIRWLPGSALDPEAPLIREFSTCAARALGHAPPVQGIEGPCDMYVFHHFGIPAILWGGRGGNTHGPDEYVELDSLAAAARALLLFVCRWCGVHSN
ncbi:MAG: M20/M25/M40 family metallo-hydrolase [Bryobacterales bacterium]|nr:M20/M25/M40 family metallo-hydrolase [Bryobacterales bacterium]